MARVHGYRALLGPVRVLGCVRYRALLRRLPDEGRQLVNLEGRSVLVVGLGISGYATATALASLGARVMVTESASDDVIESRAERLRAAGATLETGGHDVAALQVDFAIVSPGIPPDAPVMRALRSAGVDLISEIELAARVARCDLLAVTGTNGKTTTTSLLAAMLAEGGIPSTAAGNIGRPLIEAIGEVGDGGAIAVEVSSFQLETIRTFRPRVAVLLNVAEDHTDWHGSFEAYAAAKAKMIRNQTTEDIFLYNLDDETASAIAEGAIARTIPFSAAGAPPGGIGVAGDRIVWSGDDLLGVDDLPLLGSAGLEDSIAAAGAALAYGVERAAVLRALRGFRPLSHRLELVAEVHGVRYIDDSKATNPHATLAAVRGMSDVVLIAGGRSKGIDLSSLSGTVPPVVAVIAIGESRDEVERAFHGRAPVEIADSMGEAVRFASKLATRGGSVLLSPGCASLDMYQNYAQRGEDFARAVKQLVEGGRGDGES
ncbi:MAG: UDP-N-acetylmuramoyl-L-alanine--D-glutamate ligase [Actinobacteria bacterium]|nr:UDP-N-acetylmuramoyl-L-alanine--D-glutamate ligase [Actinomycetota bacterium]